VLKSGGYNHGGGCLSRNFLLPDILDLIMLLANSFFITPFYNKRNILITRCNKACRVHTVGVISKMLLLP
jgi:hypothetical protein